MEEFTITAEHSASEHEHAGRSSKGFLNAKKILQELSLTEGIAFLDAGCGTGHFSIAAAGMVGNKGTVYAVDIDHHAISSLKNDIAKRDMKNVKARVSDLTEHIPVDDGSIDLCLLANVMHGFAANKEVDMVFSEITRAMKPNGKLAVVDFKKKFSPGPPKSIRLSPHEMEKIISPFGFVKNRSINVGLFHYLIVFERKQ